MRFLPVPELHTDDGLPSGIASMLYEAAPPIRLGAETPAGMSEDELRELHRDRVRRVSLSLAMLLPGCKCELTLVIGNGTLSQNPIGTFHTDALPPKPPEWPRFNVHTTLAGAGRVLFARVGTDRDKAIRPNPFRRDHVLARYKFADPRTVNPDAYRTCTRAGVTLVSVEDGPNPNGFWHR